MITNKETRDALVEENKKMIEKQVNAQEKMITNKLIEETKKERLEELKQEKGE